MQALCEGRPGKYRPGIPGSGIEKREGVDRDSRRQSQADCRRSDQMGKGGLTMSDKKLVLKDDFNALRLGPDKHGIFYHLVVYSRDEIAKRQSITLDRNQLKTLHDWIGEL